jgi:hypothetical protein
MFCIRCFGNNTSYLIPITLKTKPLFSLIDHYIYFERLIRFEGAMYRKIDAAIEVPNTPRKLKALLNKSQ